MQTPKTIAKNWILIRGLTRSQFHWKNFGEQMQEKLGLESVQTVELSGNGTLFYKDTPLDLKEVISQLRAQVKASTSRPLGLLGISLGGMLATQWAQLHPNEVSHMVLINSSSRLSPFYQRLRVQNYLAILQHLAFSGPEKIEEFILTATSNDKQMWAPHLMANIEFMKNHPIKYKNFARQLKLASKIDFTKLPRPETLLLASKSDRLVNYKCSEKIAETWTCRIAYHETAGHDLTLDAPDWVIAQIKKSMT